MLYVISQFMNIKTKRKNRIRRHKRVRAVIKGTAKRPRLSVFRSNQHLYAQLIDDERRITLLSISDFKKGEGKKEKGKRENGLAGKKAVAFEVGEALAKKRLKKA